MDGQPDKPDEPDETHDDGVKDHQLGFYQGELKQLVARAIFYMRLFLLNMEAYPSKEELIKWAEKSFTASCQVAFGINYKGVFQFRGMKNMQRFFLLSLCRSYANVHGWIKRFGTPFLLLTADRSFTLTKFEVTE